MLPDHHFVRLTENELSFILDFDPDEKDPKDLVRWVNTVKDAIEDGVETW